MSGLGQLLDQLFKQLDTLAAENDELRANRDTRHASPHTESHDSPRPQADARAGPPDPDALPGGEPGLPIEHRV